MTTRKCILTYVGTAAYVRGGKTISLSKITMEIGQVMA